MMRFTSRNSGPTGHIYTLDGRRVSGVTTVIGKVLDKPALVNWAAEQSAGYAIEHWAELSELPLMERADKITKARYDSNRKATTRGHRIHEIGEKLAHGEPVEVFEEYRQPADNYARFLDDWQMETLATETSVCNTDYRYAGTFDAIVRSPKLGTIMIDIKTGSGVYSETALQLAAYRFCNLMLDDRPMITTEAAYVAHVLPDTVDLVPMKQDDDVTSSFLYCLELFETWIKRVGWDYRDGPSFDPVVGSPIYPDRVSAA